MSGYQTIAAACRQANHKSDLAQFVKVAATMANSNNNYAQNNYSDSGSSPNTKHHNNHHNNDHSDNSQYKTIIRYHQFQSPNSQIDTSSNHYDPKNVVSSTS